MDLARIIANLLPPWRKAPCPSDPRSLGTWGEARAADYLRRRGYRILYRNYRARGGGEVDIVAREKGNGILCFIEVKTRRDERYGRPSRAVNEEKRHLVLRGALSWLRLLNNPDVVFRFDIVEVILQPGEDALQANCGEKNSHHEELQVRHLPDAFTPPAGFYY